MRVDTPESASQLSKEFVKAHKRTYDETVEAKVALSTAKENYKKADVFSYKEQKEAQDVLYKTAGNLALSEVILDGTLQNAKRNYQENDDLLHDAAVAEAALDGVHIKVQQTNEAEQHVPVQVNQ